MRRCARWKVGVWLLEIELEGLKDGLPIYRSVHLVMIFSTYGERGRHEIVARLNCSSFVFVCSTSRVLRCRLVNHALPSMQEARVERCRDRLTPFLASSSPP